MDPGTGKTLSILAAFHALKGKKLIDRLLVVGPLSATYDVWPAEVQKWNFPYETVVLHGDNKDRLLNDVAGDIPIWCINYDGLAWLFDNVDNKWWKQERWWIVFDESTKIKRTSTARFKKIQDMLWRFNRRTILTGTPVPNGLEDLFGQVYACDLGSRLGRFVTQYRRTYFYPHGYGWKLQPDGEKRIWDALDGLFYRVSDDVLGLEPLVHNTIHVRLPPKVRKLYDQLEDDFVVELESGKLRVVNAGVLTHKLRQVANGFLYDEAKQPHRLHDVKLDALQDLYEELGGKPLLVGYEFEADGIAIAEQFNCPTVGGNVSARKRSEIFSAFNDGKYSMVAAQMGATSLSYNLQKACHHVVMFGQMWDLEIYEQFYRRVRRGGQTKTVFLHSILAKNTVDVHINHEVVTGKGSKKVRQDRLLKVISERHIK